MLDHITADGVSENVALKYSQYVNTAFSLVGGIAFLTLVVNGSTSGPLLRRLGLVTPTECRKKVIENYHQHLAQQTLNEYVLLLTDKRFEDVDFAAVKKHIPSLSEQTLALHTHFDECGLVSYQLHRRRCRPICHRAEDMNYEKLMAAVEAHKVCDHVTVQLIGDYLLASDLEFVASLRKHHLRIFTSHQT